MFIILIVAKTFYKMSSINSGTQQPCVADELAEVLNAIELAAATELAEVQAATELAEVQSATELAAANELVEVFPTVELAVVHAGYQYNTVSMGSDYSGNYGGHNVSVYGYRCSSLQYMSFEGQCCSSRCLGTGDYCECDYRDYEPVDSYDDDEINELCLFLDTGHTYDVHFDFYFHYSSIPLELTNLFNIVKNSSCDRDNQLWTYKGRGLT